VFCEEGAAAGCCAWSGTACTMAKSKQHFHTMRFIFCIRSAAYEITASRPVHTSRFRLVTRSFPGTRHFDAPHYTRGACPSLCYKFSYPQFKFLIHRLSKDGRQSYNPNRSGLRRGAGSIARKIAK